MKIQDFTKYEIARILGARALQISMNAPLLIKISQEDLERIKFDAIKIAQIELESEVLPINVKKPFPERKDEELKKAKVPAPDSKINDKEKQEMEEKEEEEISKEGEIMELAQPDDEVEEDSGTEESETE